MRRSLLVLAALLLLPFAAEAQFWELRKPKHFPSGRVSHAMCYDAKNRTTLLFGGGSVASPLLGDTWQWDGKDWKQLKPVVSPPSRRGGSMAYDSVRGKIVLFGGYGKTGALRDTWEWDGKNWTQRHPKLSPPAATGGMAYDPVHKKMLLYTSGSSRETWEWDGTSWTQRKPLTSPPPLRGGLVFDAIRKTILAIILPGNTRLQTWEWTGKNWKQVKTLTTTSKMDMVSVVYNAHRERAQVWGRISYSPIQWESWEWDGQDWSVTKPQYVPRSPLGDYQTQMVMVFDLERSRVVLFGGLAFKPPTQTYLHDTRELPVPAQSIRTIGSGCRGSNLSAPTLSGKGDPRPGGVVYFQTEKCLLLTPIALFFGFAKVRFDLKPLGAPGCIVQANPSVSILGQSGLLGAWRTPGIRLPMIPEIVGGKYWTQAVAFDPKANRLQLTVTNTLETTIGY